VRSTKVVSSFRTAARGLYAGDGVEMKRLRGGGKRGVRGRTYDRCQYAGVETDGMDEQQRQTDRRLVPSP